MHRLYCVAPPSTERSLMPRRYGPCSVDSHKRVGPAVYGLLNSWATFIHEPDRHNEGEAGFVLAFGGLHRLPHLPQRLGGEDAAQRPDLPPLEDGRDRGIRRLHRQAV